MNDDGAFIFKIVRWMKNIAAALMVFGAVCGILIPIAFTFAAAILTVIWLLS